MRQYKIFNITKALLALFLVSSIYVAGGQNAPSVSITINPLPTFDTHDLTTCYGYPVDLQTAIDNLTHAVIGDVQFSTVNGDAFETGMITNPQAYVATVSVTIYARVVNENGCESAEIKPFNITVKSVVAPPRVTTPQTFCTGATVANLQAEGVGVKWYLAGASDPLEPNAALLDQTLYYAVQTDDESCESSTRSAVKVILKSDLLLDAPNLPGIVNLCPGATLGDIPTYGNTNIVWYDASGIEITDLATPLADGASYYAAQCAGGVCESPQRTEVTVSLGSSEIEAPEMESPQQFCDGAMIANLSVPNNQIAWYDVATGGTELLPTTRLVSGTYYAAQKLGGSCSDNAPRTPVVVTIDNYIEPVTQAMLTICGLTNPTLGDLWISGTGILWYGGSEENPTLLPLNTPIAEGDEYWAVQSAGACEGARFKVTITADCYNVGGTIFPFVYTGNSTFDDNYATYVKLYTVPTSTTNRIGVVRKQNPMYTAKAVWYDGSVFIANTPKYPGTMGFFDNPGLPILWDKIGETAGTPDATVLGAGERPNTHIGMYVIENVAEGDYVIEITRQGFLTRYGVITVVSGDPTSLQLLGHRELLAGDVNSDLQITEKDFSAMGPRFVPQGNPLFMWKYDLNGDGNIDSGDSYLIRVNLGAFGNAIYKEAYDFMNP